MFAGAYSASAGTCIQDCGGTYTKGNSFGLKAPPHSGFNNHNFYNMPKKKHSYENTIRE